MDSPPVDSPAGWDSSARLPFGCVSTRAEAAGLAPALGRPGPAGGVAGGTIL